MDIALFEKAKIENTTKSYENYLYVFPSGRYTSEVNGMFEEAFFNESVKKGSVSELKRYIDTYPNGKYLKKAREEINNIRFRNFIYGPGDFVCPFVFFYNPVSIMGLNILEYNNKPEFGWYILTRFKFSRFWLSNGDPGWDDVQIKQNGSFETPEGEIVTSNEYTIKNTRRNFYLGAGLTKHVVNRLWIYSGVGIGSEKNIHYIPEMYFVVKDYDYRVFNIYAEVGANLFLNDIFSIKVGAAKYGNQKPVASFGIGLNIY
jgi:hypothetical protein